MSVTLGKRKRPTGIAMHKPKIATTLRQPSSFGGQTDSENERDGSDSRDQSSTDSDQSSEENDAEAARAAFARAFERKFAPLQDVKPVTALQTHEQDDESDFDGFESNSEDDKDGRARPVETITHSEKSLAPAALSKTQIKSFMSSKVPISHNGNQSATNKKRVNKDDDDAPTEALNLRHDLELQRLISESHLLHPDAKPARNQRQRIVDVRLQALGSKGGLLQQEKMPMAFRKGIVAKKQQREAARRLEAKENGIILERPAENEKTRREAREHDQRRERGVGGAAVGRFKGGTLQLSRRDIQAIRGPGGGSGSSRGGGRGGRGGKKGKR